MALLPLAVTCLSDAAEPPAANAPPAACAPVTLFEVNLALLITSPAAPKRPPPPTMPGPVTVLDVNVSPVETSVPENAAIAPPAAVCVPTFIVALFEVNVSLAETREPDVEA